MKSDLICLIDQVDSVESLFKTSGGDVVPRVEIINDKSGFIKWKELLCFELEDLYTRTGNVYIKSTLDLLREGFNGWKDRKSFNVLKEKLSVINEKIDIFYNNLTENTNDILQSKNYKIFISHSSDDCEYVKLIVNFLESIGLNNETLFCSSIPEYGIPLNEDIYDYLKKQFDEYNLYIIFVLSKNYYKSVACLNEMGAAWVLKNKYSTFLLPEFNFEEIRGAINPRKIGISLDSPNENINELMVQLKDTIIEDFHLPKISESHFISKLSMFTTGVSELKARS